MTETCAKTVYQLILLAVLLLTCDRLAAADVREHGELVFRSDFAGNRALNGWFDVEKWRVANRYKRNPNPEWYKVLTVDDETFLRTQTMFGISSLFKHPLKIDDSIDSIELRVTLRQPGKCKGHFVEIALTSRNFPSGKNGGPFWLGYQESGIMVRGYHYNIQYSNIIAWQKAGRQIWTTALKAPFNLLLKNDEWVTWRLVYKHCAKELWFYREKEDNAPFIVQRNVDLTGCIMNSVWLGAWGTEYLNVEVYKKNIAKEQPLD